MTQKMFSIKEPYIAEHFCLSFLNQVASIFHLGRGKIKKKVFLGLPIVNVFGDEHKDATNIFQNWGHKTSTQGLEMFGSGAQGISM